MEPVYGILTDLINIKLSLDFNVVFPLVANLYTGVIFFTDYEVFNTWVVGMEFCDGSGMVLPADDFPVGGRLMLVTATVGLAYSLLVLTYLC